MNSIMRTKEEYGGFLPLELNPGKELFAKYEDNLIRFNSVKASLDFLIRKLEKKEIWIPYYYCPSTIEAIKKTGIWVKFYHVNEKLLPDYVPDIEQAIVILVDYFGVRSEDVKVIGLQYKKASVIIDNAHSFFSKPIFADNVYNVYSAKKFIGIPDGAYLVSHRKFNHNYDLSQSGDYVEYLFNAYEKGTNAVYSMKKKADKEIAENYAPMSKLAVGLLQNVNYERIEEQRQRNYNILHSLLRDVNELDIPEKCAAYHYPLLIKEKIYVSTLWNGNDLLINGNSIELNMSQNAIFLPIDQRYNEDDMKYIALSVLNKLKLL